jgi:hypothetical protein
MTALIVKICRACANAVIDQASGAAAAAIGYRSCEAARNTIERATYFRGDTACKWPERFIPKIQGKQS